VANNPTFAKKVGVPQSVGKDFNQADKGKTFKQGGDMKQVDMKKNPGVAKLPTAVRNKMGFMKKGGMAEGGKSDMKQDKGMMQKAVNKHEGRLHKGATMTKLAGCGMAPYYIGVLLSGNNNIKLLISQAKKFKPKYIYLNNSTFKEQIKTRFFIIREERD
jgi:hypothetical protein